MKNKIKIFIKLLAGKDFLLLLILTLALYILIERSGLFRMEQASLREAFHSRPVKIFSTFFLMNAIFGVLACFRQSRGWMRLGSLFFYLALIIVVSGFWVSVYTRFEGNFVRAEGQSFGAFKGDYIQETLYQSGKMEPPEIGFNFRRIKPEVSEDMQHLTRVSADVTYAGRSVDGLVDETISSDKPFISDRTKITFVDFGYLVRFVLHDLDEKELERKKLQIKLFPAGAEERTEAMFLGYSFYIRLYPDYFDKEGKAATKSPYPKNPVFNLRIVRNKNIVYNGLVRPDEKVRFDNQIVSLPMVKMWVEMRLVRDLGLPVVAAGIPVLMLGIVMMWVGRVRD